MIDSITDCEDGDMYEDEGPNDTLARTLYSIKQELITPREQIVCILWIIYDMREQSITVKIEISTWG